MQLKESTRSAADAAYRTTIAPGEYWIHPVEQDTYLRIVDLEGNQAVDTFFFHRDDPCERYSACDTLAAQHNVYLGLGSVLSSFTGAGLLEITADTCGRHDTLGGACAAESNSVRYHSDKRHMHNCRDSFIQALLSYDERIDKSVLASNVNFFMNVPVSTGGGSSFADGISGPGKYVELRALVPVVTVISNCPQLNNPCNAYDPTPVEVLIFEE